MPRIHDNFVETAIYLYRSKAEAEDGINAGGSGFLVSIPAETHPGGTFIYAVTNRHVLEVADVARFNTSDGDTRIQHLPREKWMRSKTDDLAIVSLFMGEGVLWKQRYFPHTLILSKEKAEKINLGIGDQVFMVGRFINHEGKQQNAPLVRFGNIAQMPTEPLASTVEGKYHEQESIIADIRSIGGYSGSPVFLNELPLNRDGAEPATEHWLIGIDWGHVKLWSPVCGFDETPTGQTQVNINSGMAGIVPSWKLLDMLMSDEQVLFRKSEEEALTKAKASIGGSPDVAAPPASDANPTHRDDFTRLLGAAMKAPQSKE